MKKQPAASSIKAVAKRTRAALQPRAETLSITSRKPHVTREIFKSDQCLLPGLKMLGWSRFDKAEAKHLKAHQHKNTWEICYIVAGHVDWWAGDQIFEVTKGQVFITRPNVLHGGQDAVMHPCELYWLQITLPDKTAPTHRNPIASLARDFQTLGTKLFTGSPLLPSLFERLLTEHRSLDMHAQTAAQGTLHMLLVDVLRLAKAADAQQHEKRHRLTTRIEKIVRWIQVHLGEPMTIQQLAEKASLGVSQFRARFGEEVSQSPNDYITSQRVIRAKHLLATQPDWPITRVAHQLGFTTSQYFATVFKDRVGMTPLAYRDRHAIKPSQSRTLSRTPSR